MRGPSAHLMWNDPTQLPKKSNLQSFIADRSTRLILRSATVSVSAVYCIHSWLSLITVACALGLVEKGIVQ